MTQDQWAQVSNYAMGSAFVIVFVAFMSHLLEWFFARAAASSAQRERVLAGAGAPIADEPVAGDERSDTFARVGVSLTVLATFLLVLASVSRGIASQRAPFGNMYEFGMTGTAIALAVYCVLVWRWGISWLGGFVLAISIAVLGMAISTYVPAGPLVPALDTYWKWIHVGSIMIAGALFMVGAAASVIYLLKARAERRGTVAGVLARFPESARIDRLAFRVTAVGFPLWTFGALISGPIWAHLAWGRYWGWDPKEVWALITWAVYAGYLHARVTAGWKGHRAAVLQLIGFATFIISYYLVNLFAAGLHSYAK